MTEPMSEKIRVLHIITRMVRGGAQENTLANVAGLSPDLWESSLVTGPALGPEGSLEPECLVAGVRMLRVPEMVRELAPRSDWAAYQRLVSLFRKERPHLVHTHTSKAGILGRLAARKAGVPAVVHTPHGHVFHGYAGGLKTRLFVQAERHTARMADRLIALTPNELREHLELGIGAPDRWREVHSGINFAPFKHFRGKREEARRLLGLPDRGLVIGTVGRLVEIKGQTHLIEAFARLANRLASRMPSGHPAPHLVLIGDGDLHQQLVSQAMAAGLAVFSDSKPAPSDRATVHFPGLRKDVAALLPAFDLFALPSLNEGMGRVLVEAMAMELPCVASRVSGIPDVVVDGETGLLVPPADPAALAEALESLALDPDRARAMGEAGRRRAVPGFSVEEMLRRLESIYREVLADKGIVVPLAPEQAHEMAARF